MFSTKTRLESCKINLINLVLFLSVLTLETSQLERAFWPPPFFRARACLVCKRGEGQRERERENCRQTLH